MSSKPDSNQDQGWAGEDWEEDEDADEENEG